MKTRYKYIHFKETAITTSDNLTDRTIRSWLIKNNRSGDDLGRISFEDYWKEWTAQFVEDAIFSRSCLMDIQDFMGQLK